MDIHVKMKLGRRYAGTFLDTRMAKNDILLLDAEMQFIADAFLADPVVEGYFTNPTVSREKRVEEVHAFAVRGGFSPYTQKLLETLVRKGRGDIIPFVSHELHVTADRLLDRIRVRMTTASEPSVVEIGDLSKQIGDFFGKNVFVERAVDPELISGFILEGDGKRIDLSIQGQIKRALLGK